MVFLRYAVLLLHVSASYGFHLAHINPHKTVHATVHRPVPQRQLRCGAVRAATVVVTDMDETLISKRSTGYVIKFLVFYRAFLRLACLAIPAGWLFDGLGPRYASLIGSLGSVVSLCLLSLSLSDAFSSLSDAF